MEVKSYTFQSPYPNQLQIGRADSSSAQNEKAQQEGATLAQESNQTLKSAEIFTATQAQEVQPDVSSPERLLDVYA
jgi:hypothetical protein